jgi:hypothetical protein
MEIMIRTLLLLFVATLFFTCADEDSLEASCSVPATVKDLTGLDGCGFVFELEDGTRLQPFRIGYCGTPPLPKGITEDPLYNFQFEAGKKVFIEYEPAEGASICMAGQLVKITCIREGEASQSDL